MLQFAFAALLQAAMPAPPITTPEPAAGPPAPAPAVPMPAWRAAGRAWSDCVKTRIDARTPSGDAPAAVADAAMAGCTTQLEAVRAAIAAERGPEVAAANVERVTTSGRAMFIAYINTRRTAAAAPAAGPGR